MSDNAVKVNSLKAWVLASRPKTLSGAAVPVMIGVSLAFSCSGGAVRLLPAMLCLLFAFFMQIDANLVNDYFDFVKGTDDEKRLGPKRACAEGWVTLKAMRSAIILATCLSCAVGLPLVLYGGWNMVVVGAACVLFCFLYTTCLSYWGFGDVLVLLFFGIVPVCATYYIVMPAGMQAVSFQVFMASVSCGLAVDALLIVNNYRDIDNDRKAGKKTLVVIIGKEAAGKLYLITGIAATIILLAVFWGKPVAYAPLLYLVPHIKTYKDLVRIKQGVELNKVLSTTARNIFIYGLLVAAGSIF